ncbi:MAG: cob(I)yrinic acid a,c-diamide adenosyltransferase [Flavobacteriales bacterium]
MKIYTRHGDKGETGLLGGKRVPKNDARIEAYGTVDELNAHLGLLRDLISDTHITARIQEVQSILFLMGSHLAVDPSEGTTFKLPDWPAQMTDHLELDIDTMTQQLPELRNFILPGGDSSSSQCHIARCVCRRAERAVVALPSQDEVKMRSIEYLNRLSDYLFTLSRYLTKINNGQETLWNP